MRSYTPLRYPGGKRRLFHTVASLIEANNLQGAVYSEPFCGGASIPLGLLFEDYASVVHINDLSRPVFAFWHTVLYDPEYLCKRIASVHLSMAEWRRQRYVWEHSEAADLAELGFATLFLNRTNRSGILGGGVIGGKQQAGEWRLDARFNKSDLQCRIRRIARLKKRIHLYQADALDFTRSVVPTLGRKAFVFYDPPYIEAGGRGLYLNDYSVADHKRLARRIAALAQPWIATYDYGAVKYGIFEAQRRVVYELKYVSQARYNGREVLFLSDRLDVPQISRLLGDKARSVPNLCRLGAKNGWSPATN